MAINVLTPIETRYKGILFRSRIEARWALFFDKIGVPYEYEREGYKLDESTWYLPDFWMPQQDCFIEIKGTAPTLEEEAKASILAQQSGKEVFIFYGGIPTILNYGQMVPFENDSAYKFFPEKSFDNQHYWCQCRFCGAFDIQHNGRSGRIKCCEKNILRQDDKDYNSATNPLVSAYNAARSARFGT